MSNVISIPPEKREEVDEVVKKWLAAKDSETQWKTYRQQLEDYLTAQCGEFSSTLDALMKGTSLTKTLKLPPLAVSVGYELEFDQEKASAFIATYPHLHGVLLKPVYKPVSSKAVLTAAGADTELGRELKDALIRKQKRPGYSVA